MTESPRTPVHLWIIGVVALLWNAMGAFDYVMTQTHNEAYLEAFSEEQLAFFNGFPAWLVAFWALAVWGGVVGSLLLLLRKHAASAVFGLSFGSMLVTTVHNFGFANGAEIMGSGGMVFSAVIFAISLALVFYSRAMARSGVLR